MMDLKGAHIQKWDGKKETFDRFEAQVVAVATILNCEDALDEACMRFLPTDQAYALIDQTTPGADKYAMTIYQKNKRMCALLILAQGSSHGLAVINKMKTADCKNRKADQILKSLKSKYTPSDTGAKIELDMPLDKSPFKFANDYYNQVIAITAMYSVNMTDLELCTLAAKKCRTSLYVKMILDHIKSGTVDFEIDLQSHSAKRARRERRSWHSTMFKVKGRTNPSAQSKVAMGTIRKLIVQSSKPKRQRRSAVDVARRGLTRRIAGNAIRTRLLSGGRTKERKMLLGSNVKVALASIGQDFA
jgi:hypothetical protein